MGQTLVGVVAVIGERIGHPCGDEVVYLIAEEERIDTQIRDQFLAVDWDPISQGVSDEVDTQIALIDLGISQEIKEVTRARLCNSSRSMWQSKSEVPLGP